MTSKTWATPLVIGLLAVGAGMPVFAAETKPVEVQISKLRALVMQLQARIDAILAEDGTIKGMEDEPKKIENKKFESGLPAQAGKPAKTVRGPFPFPEVRNP